MSSNGWSLRDRALVFGLIANAITIGLAALNTKLARWNLWLAAGFFGLFLLASVIPPFWRWASSRWSIRGRLKRVRARWPAFQTKAATFRQFFTPSHNRSVSSVLQKMRKPSGADGASLAMRGRLDLVETLLTLMDRLTSNVVRDANRSPSSLDEARRIARDFEALLRVVEFQGIAAVIRELEPDSTYPDARDEFFAEYDQCRRGYREFAHEVYAEIKDSVFDGEP